MYHNPPISTKIHKRVAINPNMGSKSLKMYETNQLLPFQKEWPIIAIDIPTIGFFGNDHVLAIGLSSQLLIVWLMNEDFSFSLITMPVLGSYTIQLLASFGLPSRFVPLTLQRYHPIETPDIPVQNAWPGIEPIPLTIAVNEKEIAEYSNAPKDTKMY